jgi:YVTN family beta-propeller protein
VDGAAVPADGTVPGVPAPFVPLARKRHGHPGPVTFLFADIRGYTAFTQRHGAEAAVRLADAFIALARGVAGGGNGELRGTWGDQVLVEFDSPRDAVRAAIELQARCMERTVHEPAEPLAVGVGIDVGEPADEGEHRSAAALNVAARLCARAAPGEVLASAELAHLAGSVAGVSFVERGEARLKGLPRPTRIVLVRPLDVDGDELRRFHTIVAGHRRLRRDPRAWVAALLVLALVAALGGWLVSRGDGGALITVPAGGLAVVSGSTDKLVGAAAAGGALQGIAAGAGALWVTQPSGDAVLRLDRAGRRVVQSIPVGSTPVAVTVTDRDVWVVNSQDRSVSRVSADTNRETNRVPNVGNQPVAIATGFGSLWVVNKADGTVTRIDDTSGRILTTIEVGSGPDGVATGAGAVWVTNGRDGTVSAVDPATNSAGAPIQVGVGPAGIAVSGSGVWVANSLDLTVSLIDPVQRREVARIAAVGDAPSVIAVDHGSVWVGATASGTLVRIDSSTHAVAARTSLGASPYGIAMSGGEVWSSTRPFASTQHFGGTLTIGGDPDNFPTIDPANVASPPSARALALVYDGLVGYRRTVGVDSYDLVPDLATGLPHPTDGGRTYSFTLRPGIRYADGRVVVPADFRRAIQRQFTAQGSERRWYEGLLGAGLCGKARCDLTQGIVTTATAITFRLTAPDPEFLFKLASVAAAPVPPGTSTGPERGAAIAGTGPYAVTGFVPNMSLRLDRNPYFRSWSVAARPRGYPRTIRWRALPKAELVGDVLAGRVDMVDLRAVPPTDAARVALSHPAQVHLNTVAKTAYLVLNTTQPPFDRALARRGLALALDRSRFARAEPMGAGPGVCELLPAGFPGYEPDCTLTRNPDASGAWHGPDLAAGRRLVRASGTRGQIVELYYDPSATGATHSLAPYLTRLVRELGYHPRLHPMPASFDLSAKPWDVTTNGWLPDFPSASQYYLPLLSCAARTNGGFNIGGYCNPALDSLAARAVRLSGSDPGQADRLWRQVYRTAADDAAVIPTDHGTLPILVSARVGNYESGAFTGPLLEQLWVH